MSNYQVRQCQVKQHQMKQRKPQGMLTWRCFTCHLTNKIAYGFRWAWLKTKRNIEVFEIVENT
jgi:hypothetical protein